MFLRSSLDPIWCRRRWSSGLEWERLTEEKNKTKQKAPLICDKEGERKQRWFKYRWNEGAWLWKTWDQNLELDTQSTCYLSTGSFLIFQCISSRLFFAILLQLIMSPAIVQGKCRVQRMSELFAELWAFTLAPHCFFFCSFHFQLIFISIDKLNLINNRRGGELVPFNFSFFTVTDVKKKNPKRCAL